MFVIERFRGGTDIAPEETIDMAGTTGNIYRVTINHVPSCTCPDHQKGNQCKHIVYVRPNTSSFKLSMLIRYQKVLHNVLKAPEHLQYQLAFLSSVFSNTSLFSNM